MRASYPSYIELAVVAYCAFESRGISWMSTPSMHLGGVAFVIWCLPPIYYLFRVIKENRIKQNCTSLLVAAIALTLLGAIGSLSALQHLGLALAIASLLPPMWPMLVWIPSSASWMPALGWFARYWSLHTIWTLEVLLASVGSILMLLWIRRRPLYE